MSLKLKEIWQLSENYKYARKHADNSEEAITIGGIKIENKFSKFLIYLDAKLFANGTFYKGVTAPVSDWYRIEGEIEYGSCKITNDEEYTDFEIITPTIKAIVIKSYYNECGYTPKTRVVFKTGAFTVEEELQILRNIRWFLSETEGNMFFLVEYICRLDKTKEEELNIKNKKGEQENDRKRK